MKLKLISQYYKEYCWDFFSWNYVKYIDKLGKIDIFTLRIHIWEFAVFSIYSNFLMSLSNVWSFSSQRSFPDCFKFVLEHAILSSCYCARCFRASGFGNTCRDVPEVPRSALCPCLSFPLAMAVEARHFGRPLPLRDLGGLKESSPFACYSFINSVLIL